MPKRRIPMYGHPDSLQSVAEHPSDAQRRSIYLSRLEAVIVAAKDALALLDQLPLHGGEARVRVNLRKTIARLESRSQENHNA